jgi:hypothetical protein
LADDDLDVIAKRLVESSKRGQHVLAPASPRLAVGCFPGRMKKNKAQERTNVLGVLETLPAFAPMFVRQRIMATTSSSSDLLAEHRTVSVMFVVGQIEARSSECPASP